MTLHRLSAVVLAALAASSLSLSACTAPVDDGEDVGRSIQALSAPKKAFCSISVEGRGKKDMETDYIPHVITCENGGADLEALKAQAIAARSVAYYAIATKGSICDSQGCQVYGCGATPSERAKRAARETAGMVLSHDGTLTYGFYVAGDSGASAPGCKDYSGATSHYVTYNSGKTGNHVDQTSLGYQGPPGFDQNRGCMSQWGARCLEKHKGLEYLQILRFYYGQDIQVTQASGDCVPDTKTLRAKLTKKWSNAKRYHGKKADYVVCAKEPFEMTFSFKNIGSAIWREVKHRGKNMGSDVFLVTANGKTDELTGKKRFSLRNNANSFVRGDHKAKSCITKNGCRKTRFIQGGMEAVAPKKPGVYESRWRLRDYSKHWGKKSHGFGPKVALKVKVVSCDQKKTECGCRVWCTNGKSNKLSASIDSAAECKSVAHTFCGSGEYLEHQYTACPSDPSTGGSGSGTDPVGSAGASGSGNGSAGSGGTEPTGAGGMGGGSGSAEPPASEPEDEDIDNGVTPDDGDDGDEDFVEEDDDPDFTDDGFDGDVEGGVTPYEEGCSISLGGDRSGVGLAGLFLALAIVVRRRRNGYTG